MSARPGRRAAGTARAAAAPKAAPTARPRPRPAEAPARTRTAPARGTSARPRVRTRPRADNRRLLLVAIPLIALLLAGIVWVNVATLGLTAGTGAVVERARAVEADNNLLQNRLEQRDAAVADRAQDKLGMVPSSGESVTYLDARRP